MSRQPKTNYQRNKPWVDKEERRAHRSLASLLTTVRMSTPKQDNETEDAYKSRTIYLTIRKAEAEGLDLFSC